MQHLKGNQSDQADKAVPRGKLFGGERANFASNLNGLFALPGMAPNSLPPNLTKKLSPQSVGSTDTEGDTSKKDNEQGGLEKVTSGLSDIRQRRAKGPRGRKLPSKIANVEKVEGESKKNDIQVFDTWVVTFAQQNDTGEQESLEKLKSGDEESKDTIGNTENTENTESAENTENMENGNQNLRDGTVEHDEQIGEIQSSFEESSKDILNGETKNIKQVTDNVEEQLSDAGQDIINHYSNTMAASENKDEESSTNL